MLKKIILAAFAAALVVVLPKTVDAYGACHVGYTHVGPNGAYHTSETVARGPEGGVYAGGHTTTYGAGGSAYGAHYSTGTEYHYAPSTSGAAYGHTTTTYGSEGAYGHTTTSYGYVR